MGCCRIDQTDIGQSVTICEGPARNGARNTPIRRSSDAMNNYRLVPAEWMALTRVFGLRSCRMHPDRAGFSEGDERWPKQRCAETSSVYGCRSPARAGRPRHRRPHSPGRRPSSTPCPAAGGTHTAPSWGGCCRGPASLDRSPTCGGMSETFIVATDRSLGRPSSYLLPTALQTVRSLTATPVCSLSRGREQVHYRGLPRAERDPHLRPARQPASVGGVTITRTSIAGAIDLCARLPCARSLESAG
jgi:hypothetical protein